MNEEILAVSGHVRSGLRALFGLLFAALLGACDGSLSIHPVNDALATKVSVEAQVLNFEDLQRVVASKSMASTSAAKAPKEEQYLAVLLRNSSAQGVWGELDVLLQGQDRYRFRVPHLEPLQQSAVVYVAYLGSGWSSYGPRPYEWVSLHGK